MVPESKGSAQAGWPAGGKTHPAPVYIHESPRGTSPRTSPPPVTRGDAGGPAPSRHGLALDTLRIRSAGPSSSSTTSTTSSSVFAGREVQQVERKSDEPDEPDGPPTPDGSPLRTLRSLGAASPGMARYQALLLHLPALTLSRDAAIAQAGGSDRQLRRQLAMILTQAQLHTGKAPTLPQACVRLLGVSGFSPALVSLAAGALVRALSPPDRPLSQADRQGVVDAVLGEALREAASPGAADAAVAVLEGLCEALHGTGHWMPQAAPFVHLVVDRLLAPGSSPRAPELLRVVTTRMLLLQPPAQLPAFLVQVLRADGERTDRLRALVHGLAAKTSPAPNDACIGQFAGHVLQAGYPERDLIAFARELAHHTALWAQACEPRVLPLAAFGRLLLASSGAGAEDDAAKPAGEQTAASSITTRAVEVIETKSGPRRVPASRVDRVAQVQSLRLTLAEGSEGRLAREIVAVHRALEGDTLAREALRARILALAPESLELTMAAMACGWGIAVGAESMGPAAFKSLAQSFTLPQAKDPLVWLVNGSLQLGLAAARNLNGLTHEADADPGLRAELAAVCRQARGPLDDRQFAAELTRHAQLEEPPLAAVLRLDDLVQQFDGTDFDLLVTARTYLLDHAVALQSDPGFDGAYGLDKLPGIVDRIQTAAYDVVLRRFNLCLWMVDEAERQALLKVARAALAFLQAEAVALLDDDCPLPMSEAQQLALGDNQLKLEAVILQLDPQADADTGGAWAGPSLPEGKGRGQGQGKG